MPHFKKCIFVDDLLAVTFFSCLGAVFVLIPPFNETFFRIPLALPLFFFIPGYAFISAFFPGKKEISGIERFTLSVGFSLVLTVFDGFLISLLPWGYRPGPIAISIVGITAFFSIFALFTRKLLDENDQFSFSIKEFISSIQSHEIDNSSESSEDISICTEKRRFHRSRSRVKAKGLKYLPGSGIEKKPLSPEIEKALIIALIGSIIISSGMLAYAKITREKETFTALYILGPDGKAEGYPTESILNVPLYVTVGIENHELQDVNYILQMKADDEVIEELNISIKEGGTWQKDMAYNRQKLKGGRSKLEFALFKGELGYSPYRSVHLYIQNNNSFSHIDPQKYLEFSWLPSIENGQMESLIGWNFTSNTDKITGSYVNSSGINFSSAYRIVSTYEGNISEPLILAQLGEISQSIECKNDTTVVISAYVKDNVSSSSNETDAQFKQVTVNGATIWTDEVTGNKGWQRLEIPVSLHAGLNNMTFGLKQTSGKARPVEVLWDNISFESLANVSSYVSENNTVEALPPISTVGQLPLYTYNTTFNVYWNGTDDSSGIAYYSIDYSTDGINWNTWISKTVDNSTVFTGEHNQTYYFRSKAVDNAGNEEPEHLKPDTQTKVYTESRKVLLDISPNPCKDATNFIVSYPVPLRSVVCLVAQDGFKPDSGELVSSDGYNWTGSYIVRSGDHFYVEAVCTDIYGNTVSALDEFRVDDSMPDFEIEITPKTIDIGDLEIKVTPSTALKNKPSVSISANEDIDVTFLKYSDGEYFYTARIDSEINEGTHKVYVTGYGMESEEIKGNNTFLVDHSG